MAGTTTHAAPDAPAERPAALPARHAAQEPDDARALLAGSGCIVVRNLLSAPAVDGLRRQALDLFARRDAMVASGELVPDARAVIDDNAPFHWLERSPEGRDARQRVLASRLLPWAEAAMGARLTLLRRSVFRRQEPRPVDSHTPFHQDAAFLKSETPVAIAWIALDRCGVDAPGLELVLDGARDLLPFAPGGRSRGNYGRIEIDPAALRERFGPRSFWAPRFEPGDLCLMHDHTIHRTVFRPGMSRARCALILRFGQDVPPCG